jgi:hypothetical protein
MIPKGLQARVTIERKVLIEALHKLGRICEPVEDEQASIGYGLGKLTIEVGGVSVVLPAHGFWDGELWYGARSLLELAEWLLDDDPLMLDVVNGSMRIGAADMGGVWEPTQNDTDTPIDEPFTAILALRYQHTPEEIEQFGLRKVYEDAWASADHAIANAVAALSHLGVTDAHIRDMVRLCLGGSK